MGVQVEAVVFDLDGVITDTAHYHYRAWKKLADELNIYFDEAINERLKGVDRLSCLDIILERAAKQYTEQEKNLLANRKNEYYKQLIKTMPSSDILPGALDVLKALKERGIKTGLASVSKNAFTVVEKLDIKAYFDYIVDAKTIKRSKPDPEIFLTAAERLNVHPEKCIGVEDAEAGVQAIKAAGMYAVGVGDPSNLHEADDVIQGLEAFDIDKYMDVF
ncbi:MAG: beta-phosphoglucomutase [Firmicutes bacterium]|nr:beta-phosphoglucomutase [Bacillota bacterium]